MVWTYEQLLDLKNAYAIRSRLTGVLSAVAEGKLTVRLTLDRVQPDLLSNLASYNTFILPKHLGEQGVDFAKTAVGTGPFKVASFDRTRGATYARYESYWQAGRPYIDGMEMFFGLDASSRLAAFLTKKTDLTAAADKKRLEDITSRLPETRVGTTFTDLGNALVMKLDRPPFDDARVRRAVHLGIDRPGLIKLAGFGEGVTNPPGMNGSKKGWAIPPEELAKLPGYRQPKDQDYAEAKKLLEEAGYPQGLKTTVTYNSQRQADPVIIEPVAGQLRSIGVEVTLDGRPGPEQRRILLDGAYDVIFDNSSDMSFQRQLQFLHSRGPLNKMGLKDEQVDRLLDVQGSVLDLAERKRASLELQRLLLDRMYVVPTIELAGYQVWQPWVNDYFYNQGISEVMESFSLGQLWLDQELMPADRRRG